MITVDPVDALAVADARGRRLRAEADAERLRGAPGRRHTIAEALRRLADRLDPLALAASAAPAPRPPVEGGMVTSNGSRSRF